MLVAHPLNWLLIMNIDPPGCSLEFTENFKCDILEVVQERIILVVHSLRFAILIFEMLFREICTKEVAHLLNNWILQL